jgi:quercetin dioxygenase-like cupin family protein
VPLEELIGAPQTGDPRVHLRPIRRDGTTYVRLTHKAGGTQAYKQIIPGEVAEFGTHVPHWMSNAGTTPVELLILFGPQGERTRIRARPRPNGG